MLSSNASILGTSDNAVGSPPTTADAATDSTPPAKKLRVSANSSSEGSRTLGNDFL